jgi:hypothetical protein
MPNIIEQQDLLKGLPDNRLAMLLQQPTGDIPPFLVAAEAQRRQTIRQQFAGNQTNESVVDTLTKQIARTPQNLQAPAQRPPVVPPTPQMAGVAALQQQQAMEQAAQNAVQQQPQQMRAGGQVRRFAPGGWVPAVVPATSTRVKDIADQFGITVDQAAEMIRNNPNLGEQRQEPDFGKPYPVIEDNDEPFAKPLELDLPGITNSQENIDAKNRDRFREDKYNEMYNYGGYDPKKPMTKGLSAEEITRENQLLQQRLKMQEARRAGNPEPLTGDTEQGANETDDDYRARIAALYDGQEPGNWEKAQRWFSMAEQFLDPSKTTMQSVAGAGGAFARDSAAMNASQRQNETEREKALLAYDIAERDRELAIEAERAKREYESMLKREERRTLGAGDAVSGLNSTLKVLNDQMASIDEDITLDAETKEQMKAPIRQQIESVYIRLASIMKASGYDSGNVLTMDQLRAMAAKG